MAIDKFYRKGVFPAVKIKSLGDISQIWISPSGSDANGDGSFVNPYATLTKAMAMVTSVRKTIILLPGDYTEAAVVAWSTISGVSVSSLLGADVTSITNAAGESIITVTPGVGSGTWTGGIGKINIVHYGNGQKGITFDNTSMGRKLVFSIKNCPFRTSTAYITNRSINVETHTDTNNAIRLSVSDDGNQNEICGAIYFKTGNWADRLYLDQLWIKGTITTSTDSHELMIRLRKCICPAGLALAGGNALQQVHSMSSYVWTDASDLTPETFVALSASTDLNGSHTEVVVA